MNLDVWVSSMFGNLQPMFFVSSMIVCGALLGVSRVFFSSVSRHYRALPGHIKTEFDSRIVSNFHAIFMVGSALSMIQQYPQAIHIPDFPAVTRSLSSPTDRMLLFEWDVYLSISFGYIAYDTLLVIFNWSTIGMPAQTIAHHIGLYASQTPPLHHYFVGLSFLCYLFEASTPFVNNRWFIDHLGQVAAKHPELAKTNPSKFSQFFLSHSTTFANGLAMTLVFFASRILLNPYVVFKLYYSFATQGWNEFRIHWILCSSFSIFFMGLNFYWFSLMVRGIIKRFYKKPSKSRDAKNHTTKSS
eukprot:ANDGO_03335.mRNA.1 hypothetical protein